MTNRLTLGAVIRALNEEEHIGRLLVGLQRQTVKLDEIVLVDSGSTDATVSIAETFGVNVVTIRPDEFTFGRSLNRGFEVSTADVVLVLSAHVYPLYDNFVEEIVSPHYLPDVAISYGRQVGDERTHFSEARVLRQWFPETGSGRQAHPFCNNANAAVRRSTWQQLRYDESLTGLEDIEFAARAQAMGQLLHYVAGAPVAHIHSETQAQVRNRYRREAMAYGRIHTGWRMTGYSAVSGAIRNISADLGQAIADGESLAQWKRIFEFRAAQFLGSWEGGRNGHEPTEELRKRMYYPAAVGSVGDDSCGAGRRIDYSNHEVKRHVD